MNTHIKKLFDRALDQAVPETWTQLSHEQMTELASVFADIMVQDNIQTLRGNGYDDAAQVLQDIHFGIEDPV
jgi:hypothetical protein